VLVSGPLDALGFKVARGPTGAALVATTSGRSNLSRRRVAFGCRQSSARLADVLWGFCQVDAELLARRPKQ
jgi:hypothetical protein